MLFDELSKANIEALKAHDKSARAVLSVVLSRAKMQKIEVESSGGQLSDNDVVRIISKVLKELEEEKAGYEKVNNLEEVESIKKQMEVISKYLPKMLSEEEIRSEINKLADKSIPSIMKHFKANFEGKVDMGLVNKVARSVQ